MVILKLSFVFLMIGLVSKITVKSAPQPRALLGKGVSCSKTFDIIIILDSSLSVGRDIWPKEVEFAKSLIKLLSVSQKDTHVGVIDFSWSSFVRVDMNKPEGYTPDSIQHALDKLKKSFQGENSRINLALASAIQMYNEVPANRKVPKLLIVVTDGQASYHKGHTGLDLMRPKIASLKLLDVNRIAVGVGSEAKRSELEFIATSPDNVILESNFKALLDNVNKILIALCKPPPKNVDGGFSVWKEVGCTKSCGGGEKNFTRTCTNPKPKYNGKQCVGQTSKTEGSCNKEPCPIDGGFSVWKEVGCSKSCGGGEKKFTRTCTNPKPKYNGKKCVGQTSKTEGKCNEKPCPSMKLDSVFLF